MCREDAVELSSLKNELAARTPPVRLIAIAGETLGHEEFTEDYWNGELYFDLGKEKVFGLIQEQRVLVKAMESFLTGYHMVSGYVRTGKKQIKSGSQPWSAGDLVNGGLWVIGAADQGILFEHGERAWGASVVLDKIDDLRKAIALIKPQSASGDVAG
mmetsp:Transcript_7/g.16  ORF Transcript_7/g.16 Transcript_7/m.16 type:complete len:158 (+) Transcript_7:165-638(+)